MSDTIAQAGGWRSVPIRWGDTMQVIALREMGNAARWVDIASLNNLAPPYLTGDPAEASASEGRLKLYGQTLYVFAPSPEAAFDVAPDEVYGVDIALDHGSLGAADGDFALVAGVPNLRASLIRVVETNRRELLFHPTYGSSLRTLIGHSNGALRAGLAARYARAALESDVRVRNVDQVKVETTGDTLAVTATVNPIQSGTPFSLRAEV